MASANDYGAKPPRFNDVHDDDDMNRDFNPQQPPNYSYNSHSSSNADTLAGPSNDYYADPYDDHASYYPSDKKGHLSQSDSTYLDHDYSYHDKTLSDATSSRSLVDAEADMAGRDVNKGKPPIEDFEFSEPNQNKSAFAKFMDKGKFPLEQRIENKKRGIGRQKYPFVSWALTVAMISVMIYELVRNSQAQGSPISTKPVFNPMIGPSQSALINFGARYPLCMKTVTGIPSDIQFGCLNNTANPPTSLCSLEDICGFGGFHGKEPNQWFRFITPIFIHAGIIHIILNMLAQLLVSAQVEKEMGSGGFIILYFMSGIFGNILGGNFALVGAPSVGASGAIFGTVAATWIDLFTHWRYKWQPTRQLMILILELIFGIGLGYIPGIDNFAHLGGFFMGLLISTIFYPVVSVTKRHKLVVWGCRVAAIPVVILLMVLLTHNFYTGDPYAACSGCRYLSCFPTNSNNHCKGTGISITNSTSPGTL